MKNTENELKILELISQGKENISQRDISRIIGMSLGMTNSILKRFAEKGLIKIKKVNNRNISYVLTARGIEEIGKRSWGYFKRTIKNVVVYRDALNEIIQEAINDGYKEINFIGESDFLFIIEHECYKLDIPFKIIEIPPPIESPSCFIFIAETEIPLQVNSEHAGYFSLNRLIFR